VLSKNGPPTEAASITKWVPRCTGGTYVRGTHHGAKAPQPHRPTVTPYTLYLQVVEIHVRGVLPYCWPYEKSFFGYFLRRCEPNV